MKTESRCRTCASGSSLPRSTQVVTDQDGYFTATKLRPGDYLVRIGPRAWPPEILPQFSESDLKIVDQDLETSYWPGVPIPVSSGASLSVGTITARKAAYYRAHLSVQPGDCEPDENWQLAVRTGDAPDFGTSRQVPCSGDFLVRNLLPGLHSFVLSTDDRRRKEKRWAIASVEVTDHNLEVTMTMSAGADIIGRLVAAEGAALPGKTTVVVTPVLRGWGFTTLVSDAGGTFQIHSLPGDPSQVSARDMGDKFYVKEVRYNGLLVADGVFTPVSGPANLEIVIDDKAATISGSVAERDKVAGPIMVVAVKWPLAPDSSSVSMLLRKSINTPADEQGKFQIDGLAPGEYRVFAVTEDYRDETETGHLDPAARSRREGHSGTRRFAKYFVEDRRTLGGIHATQRFSTCIGRAARAGAKLPDRSASPAKGPHQTRHHARSLRARDEHGGLLPRSRAPRHQGIRPDRTRRLAAAQEIRTGALHVSARPGRHHSRRAEPLPRITPSSKRRCARPSTNRQPPECRT